MEPSLAGERHSVSEMRPKQIDQPPVSVHSLARGDELAERDTDLATRISSVKR